MARRPPSSSARPYTADRPSTARPSTSTAYFDHQPQYTYSAEYTVDEDDDDESDAEDVFAFGPPSTADQQPPVLQPSQQELPHDLHPNTLTIAPQASERPPSPASSPVTFPPPTFDLYGVDRFSPVPGPSTLHPRHPYPYPLSPVESPPSTDSQSHDGSPYRMHRLQTAVSMTPTTPISPHRDVLWDQFCHQHEGGSHSATKREGKVPGVGAPKTKGSAIDPGVAKFRRQYTGSGHRGRYFRKVSHASCGHRPSGRLPFSCSAAQDGIRL